MAIGLEKGNKKWDLGAFLQLEKGNKNVFKNLALYITSILHIHVHVEYPFLDYEKYTISSLLTAVMCCLNCNS